MIPSGLKVLLPVMALVTVLATSADTLDQPSSKVMVRGCKAMIVQKQPSDILVAEDKEIGLQNNSVQSKSRPIFWMP